jgi:predicted RND superfamily exporter protein
MSHLRRGIALILLALFGWLVAFGAMGAVAASASDDSPPSTMSPSSACC